jgi:hypothetical protein
MSCWKKVCLGCALFAAMAIASSAQAVKRIVNFNGSNGAYPGYVTLVQGTDGNFYGTTEGGGFQFDGTVFRTTPSGTATDCKAHGSTGRLSDSLTVVTSPHSVTVSQNTFLLDHCSQQLSITTVIDPRNWRECPVWLEAGPALLEELGEYSNGMQVWVRRVLERGNRCSWCWAVYVPLGVA